MAALDPLAGLLPGTTNNADPDAPAGFDVAGSFGTVSGTGAGKYGFTADTTGGAGMVGTAVEQVWDFLNTPFTTPLSTTTIFLIVGIVAVAIVLWNLILFHIRVAAEAI